MERTDLRGKTDALLDGMTRQIADHQMALRVVFELLERGPGNAGQLAERMTEYAEDGEQVKEEWVEEALCVLDPYALLDYPSLDDDGVVALRGATHAA